MNQKFNFVFCKHRNNGEYCYSNCKKECPSVSNLWYRFIRNPIVNLFTAIKYKFVECNQQPTKCSFLYRSKYCLLKNRNCYSNRENEVMEFNNGSSIRVIDTNNNIRGNRSNLITFLNDFEKANYCMEHDDLKDILEKINKNT